MAHMWFSGVDLPKNRLPSSRYEGTNGFRLPDSSKPGPGSDPSAEPSWAALDAHCTAQYILTQKDRPIPTLEQMREELKPDTPETIKKRIADLQAQHLSDLQRMYIWHAEEYLDDAKDMYLSFDEAAFPKKDEINEEGQDDFSIVFEELRRYIPQQMRWQDQLERLRHSHLEQLVSLYNELKQTEIRAEEERKRREADFPTSIEDYHSKPADVKMRVARFLNTTDEARQEKILSEFGWASRQVRPLQELFMKNDAFKAEIVLKMMEVKDPRQRVF